MAKQLPSLNALRAFEVTARLGSVTQAAARLNVTTSAVSHLLRRLQDELALRLFRRESGGLVLTEPGRAYYTEVAAAFERLESATARLVEVSAGPAVQITAMPAFAIKWLVPRLEQFCSRYRDIDVRIGTTTRIVDLDTSGDDLGIRFGNGGWPGLTAQRLFDETVQPVASPSLLRGKHRGLRPAQILRLPLIYSAMNRDDWGLWARVYGLDAPRPARGPRFDEPLGALHAALAGQGVVLAPMALVHADLLAGRLVALLADPIPLVESYYVVHPSRLPAHPAAAAFKRWLIAAAKAYARDVPKPKRHALVSSAEPGEGAASAGRERGRRPVRTRA